MRTFVLTLGALAASLATAHEYPNCESDNCYRNLIDERFADKAVAFCPEFLSGTTTAADAIPTEFNNCDGNVKAVSSACSCITYSASSTTEVPEPTSTTEVPEETTTETPEETTTETPEETTTETPEETTTTQSPEETTTETPEVTPTTTEAPETTSTEEPEECTSDEPEWTTSTITISTTRTITQCPSAVPDCPNGHTTVTTDVIVTTTVCPVTSTETEEPEEPTSTGSYIPSSVWGTITRATTTTGPRPTTTLPVTGGAGRAVRGVEGIAAVAGLVAAFL